MTETVDDLIAGLEEALQRRRFRKLDFFIPYTKQRKFIALGKTMRERLLMAGNQVGKTEVGAAETAFHMTGLYPPDWEGRRWDRPTRGWIDGETSLLVRDVQQNKLMGPPGVPEAMGTGYIPKELIVDYSLARGVTDAYDTIQVRHKSGGISTATFKSYEQGRKKHQGEPVDWIWLDEEPPGDIYSECLTRTTATGGMVFCTFTPLNGMSTVVVRYMNEKPDGSGMVLMTIDDAEHIPLAERAKIIAAYPAHERDARARGVPMLGSGRVYRNSEESIAEAMMEHIPPHWVKLWGVDFGIDHPFAAVLMAWDRDNDVIHILHTIRLTDTKPMEHAAAMRNVAAAVPVAWPHDGNNRDKGSLDPLASQYRSHALAMLPTHSTWPDGGYSREAAVAEIDERMVTGRFKVASHLSDWFEEYRLYHRKDGLIVRLRDDIMSATEKLVMMKRFARAVPLGKKGVRKRIGVQMASDIDFDLS